jgi:hypothetical protein
MTPLFLLLKQLDLFRVDELEEEVGCDFSHHKGFAYDSSGVPDDDTLEKFKLDRSAHQLEISQRRGTPAKPKNNGERKPKSVVPSDAEQDAPVVVAAQDQAAEDVA